MKKIHIAILAVLAIATALWYVFVFSNKWRGNEYQEYKNDQYGFWLEYPKSWYALGDDPESSVIRFSDTAEESGDGGTPLGAVMDVIVSENYVGIPLQEWISQSLSRGPEQEIASEDEFAEGNVLFSRKVFVPISGPVQAGPIITAYASLNGGANIIQINYMGREPNYTAGMKHFDRLLRSFDIAGNSSTESASAGGIVVEYMKRTLGSIPESNVDYETAKMLLTPSLAEQFADPLFIPQSYCMQDGPTAVRVSDVSKNQEMNWTSVFVEAEYDNKWTEMWEFQVVPVEGGSQMINKINCLFEYQY